VTTGAHSPPDAGGTATAELVATVRLTQVLGADGLGSPDPTEDYHEASRMYPGVSDPYVLGAARLERSVEMRVTASRSVKRYAHLPAVSLPSPSLADATLATALARRRSRHDYGDRPLAVEVLATLLHAAYGVTGLAGPHQALRSAPSGGALYPLELYVLCRRVEEVGSGLYHYDPLRHVLEQLRQPVKTEEMAELTPYEELVLPSAAVIVLTAVFWRSRFKYGQRAYRFTLLEAGHAAQNLLLAAAALGLTAQPVGGFYDRRVDGLVGADGLHEASLYLLPVASADG
jgi:SagB-type dehydrogenase family enzyme